MAAWYDRDHDGTITCAEYPGTNLEFGRLDLDLDGALTESTSAFPSLGSRTCSASRRAGSATGTGTTKISPSELNIFLNRSRIISSFGDIIASVEKDLTRRQDLASRELFAFLAMSDFQDPFDVAARRGTLPPLPRGVDMTETARQDVLLRSFFRRELGSWEPGPSIDSPAPDFTLESHRGGPPVTLSKLYQTAPVFLIFGNLTCGGLRNHVGSLELSSSTATKDASFRPGL